MKTINELMSLKGRVSLVAGGAGHLGKAVAEAHAEAGAGVVLLDLPGKHLEKTVEAFSKRFPGSVSGLPADLADREQLRSVPGLIQKQAGRLDVLVNCAALVGTTPLEGWAVPFEKQSMETWDQALQVNLSGPFFLVQQCAPLLAASGNGAVINISSIYGMVGPDLSLYEGTELGNPGGYAASKGALIQLTRWLSTVLAPDIRVNTISPGGISRGQDDAFTQRYTRKTPLGRMGIEEDIKGAALFFASDLSSYVTGQNLAVDGGWTAW